ncbi:kinesin-like protein KIFC3 isoform X2 [Pseudophryne corroboree]
MVGPQEPTGRTESEPQERPVMEEQRGTSRPQMMRRPLQEGRTLQGKRQPEVHNEELQVHLQLLPPSQGNSPENSHRLRVPEEQEAERVSAYRGHLQQQGGGLHHKLHQVQEMLEQKQKEHAAMCRKLQEMQREAEEKSSLHPQLGGTDLEKHHDLLVSENGRLRQELQLLWSRLDCENSQELVALRGRIQLMEEQESERKTLICTLQREVQQKAERLAEAELRVRDSVSERVEEEERLNRRLRELSQQPQIKYVVQTVQVESGKMKAALSQAENCNQHLQEQLDRRNRELQDRNRQLLQEQEQVAKLQAQLALYAAELDRSQAQMVDEFQCLQEQKELAVSEAFERAQEEMRAVHHSLDGVRRNLLMLQPALRTLTHDYNTLKRQVRDFPGLLSDAMQEARDEFSQAVTRVQDANCEILSKYRRELHLRKDCHNQLMRLRGNIRVLARVRPITAMDGTGPGAQNVVTFDQDDDGILHVAHKAKNLSFELDKVFMPSTTQEEVFTEVSPLITSCLDGYSVCILAYGQTGSGKTFSMEGTPSNPGINQRALRLLLAEVSERSSCWEHHLSISMVEIYNESLRDLLGSDCHSSLDIKMSPGGAGELYVPGLTQRSVRSIQDINKILEMGHKQRATEHTNLNVNSSRSHALLILTARGRETSTGICTTGKLYLVDLAGSERVSRSGAAGDRLKEAQYINRSLSALGDVFSALRSHQVHVPYRNSKLTYLLQEALSRDGKALLLLQVSPIEQNVSETLCSLRFGDRVRAVELGVPARRTEQLPSLSAETSVGDTPPARGARSTSVRRKAPSSVRHRIGPS